MKIETQLVHIGSNHQNNNGFINPSVQRGSTVIYGNMKEMEESAKDPLKQSGPVYGRFGTPAAKNFEASMSTLEGGYASVCTCSGLSAITTAIMAFAETGDHILITDSAYLPTRNFCQFLTKMGIEVEYYEPGIGSEISALFRERTRLVFMESPGSQTFEVQDVRAIAQACQQKGVITLIDNTWATPFFFKPLECGVDVSIHAATKYITGHSDSLLGIIVCNNKENYELVRTCAIRLGQCAGADDIYFGLRGLRTLSTRLRQHQIQAIELAQWLQTQPMIESVLCPALEGSAGHEIWKRDFTGAAGLFSVVLRGSPSRENVNAMLDSLKIFGLGHSWGGFESLIVPADPGSYRTTGDWKGKTLLRIHVGFESLEDLKKDLEHGFQFLNTL